MLPPTIKGKARRREGGWSKIRVVYDQAGRNEKGGLRSFYLFFIENEEGRGWPTVRVI